MSQRVCLVLLTGLGDVVHGLPIANALKRSGVASHITWVAEPVPAQVLTAHPAVDEVVVFHKKAGLRGVLRLARELRGPFDLTLNLNVYIKSVWPTVLSRAPRRIGFDRARSHEGVWLFANEHLRPGPRAHTQDLFLEFLDVLQTERSPLEWRIAFTPQERAAQHEFFAGRAQRPVVALAAVSANPKKDWIPGRYARVVDALAREFDAETVIVGGPARREQLFAAEITRTASVKPTVALGNDVRRMMWLVAGSDLLIAPDTGPVHVARACNVPVIGLYGHTNPWRVGPYRCCEDLWVDRYTEPGAPADPSNATPRLGRMELITVDDVMARVRHAFATRVGSSARDGA
jgi:heptosyltransferase I